MIDIRLIKENPDEIIARYEAKEAFVADEIAEILRLDGERRAMIAENEALKAEQNKVTKQIPMMKKNGEDTAPVFARMKELSDTIKANDQKQKEIDGAYRTLMLSLPNLPDTDLKPGGKENNEVGS